MVLRIKLPVLFLILLSLMKVANASFNNPGGDLTMKKFVITLALLASFPAAALDELVGTTTGPVGDQAGICATVKRDVAADFANRTGAQPGSVSECNCRLHQHTLCSARACGLTEACLQPSQGERGRGVGTASGLPADRDGICAAVKRDVAADFANQFPGVAAGVSECTCWEADKVMACSARACKASGNCAQPDV